MSISNQVYDQYLNILDEAIQFHSKKHDRKYNLLGVGLGRFLVSDLAKRKNYGYFEDSEYKDQMACAKAVANLFRV